MPDTPTRILRFLSALVAGFALASAHAGSYPARSVTIVVPFAPGGPTDVTARALGVQLAPLIGQPVVVENRPGAGSRLGARYVADAAPDGYTLLWASGSSLAVAPLLYKDIGYDPQKSFAPVSLAASTPFLIVVASSVPAQDFQEMLKLAKREPGRLHYSSAGNGSSLHLLGEMIKSVAGVELTHVPYKGGADARNAVLAGQAQVTFDAISVLGPYVAAGRLRAMAVTAGKRHPLLPDVPTTAEAGFPGVVATAWFGMVAPAKTPASAVERLNEAMRKALGTPAIQEQFARLGFEARATSPGEFAALIAEDRARYKRIIDGAGIRVD